MSDKNKIKPRRNEKKERKEGIYFINQVSQDLLDKLNACTYICNMQNLTNNGLTQIFYFTDACEKNQFDVDALLKRNFASLIIYISI